jgi:hypothetical protein
MRADFPQRFVRRHPAPEPIAGPAHSGPVHTARPNIDTHATSEFAAMRENRRLEPKRWGLLVLFACCGSAAVPEALAEDGFVDPPGRVARVSFIDGAVSIAPAMSDEWGEAVLNRPLTSGDRIWVDAGGRAELEVGSATIRLGDATGFSFVNLTDDALQMRLTGGVMTLRVHTLAANSVVDVVTPNSTVTPLQPGEYTVETAEAGGQTIVKTRSGEATVAGAQQAFGVAANEQGVFTGNAELIAEITAIGPRSPLEDWAYARDARELQSVTARYVAPEVIGYRDLDDYGTWYDEPEYGHVWQPTYVVADWAPYRYGRWTWVSPWGWTWIDDAPWGFAPSHYGRWTYLRQRWCWVPGPYHLRPVYAPALVGWVGDPYYGYGNVGWFPLAPREAYLPGYRSSWGYFNNVNVSNTWIVNNTYINNAYYGRGGPIDYHNRRVPHATTVVHRDDFVSARGLGGHRARIDDDDLKGWRTHGRAPTIMPGRDSIVGVRSDTRPPRAERWAADNREQRRAVPVPRDRTVSASAPAQPRGSRAAGDVSGPRPAAAPTARTGQAAASDRGDRPPRNAAGNDTMRRYDPMRPPDQRQAFTSRDSGAPIQASPRPDGQRRNDRPAVVPDAAAPPRTVTAQRRPPSAPQRETAPIEAPRANYSQRAPTTDTRNHRAAPIDRAPQQVPRPNVATRPSPEAYQRQPEPRGADDRGMHSLAAPPVSARTPERAQSAPLEQRRQRVEVDARQRYPENGQGERTAPRTQDAPAGPPGGGRDSGFGSRQQWRSDQR